MKTKTLYVLPIILVLSMAIASANVLIAGQVFNSDFSSRISGAELFVTCEGNSLLTNSLNDGTYAVVFNDTQCAVGDSASVTSSKPGYNQKEEHSTVNKCDTIECNDFAIINFNLITATTSSGGNGGSSHHGVGYFLCGDGKCDSGETTLTCPKDCPVIELASNLSENNLTKLSDNNINGFSEIPNNTKNQNTPGITGAVVGALKSNVGIIVIVFIIIIAGSFVGINVYRKRK